MTAINKTYFAMFNYKQLASTVWCKRGGSLAKKYINRPHAIPKANFSSSSKLLQLQLQSEIIQDTDVTNIDNRKNIMEIKFQNGVVGYAPHLWLRENCQCPKCFDRVALGRRFLLTDLSLDIRPKLTSCSPGEEVKISWSDGHVSSYRPEWLYYRAFTKPGKDIYKNLVQVPKKTWGNDLALDCFNYEDLKKDDKVLLRWLKVVESKGVALIKNTPIDDDAGPSLIDHIAFVKPSHYGRHSPVINRPNSNNVAFTNAKLGMHNDLAQYEYQAGIIFIHALKQEKNQGGDSVISDGLYSADILKEKHPKAYEMLTKTDVYFWDKGHANYDWEMDYFYKITKSPILRLNNANEIDKVSVNNVVRDSFIDLPPEKVNEFYKAMKTYNDTLYENAFCFKMEEGDMITMDNVRCLHGREGYETNSERHIESSYLDWDEARCKRRRLQEKYQAGV